MIQDIEQQLNDELGKADIKDLLPDFDNEQAWAELSHKMQPKKKVMSLPVWRYAAAILLLITAGYLTRYFTESYSQIAVTDDKENRNEATSAKTDTAHNVVLDIAGPSTFAAATDKKQPAHRKPTNTGRKFAANDVIYNGTPCPIELRISQTMRCPNHSPTPILSSSTLAPDKSAQLNYKESNTLGKDCSLTLKEIEIKSIATGEVILLNAKSSPSTAQEVFGYITREKEGRVLAGVFNRDCGKKNRKHNLRLDNSDGNLILE